MHVKLARRPSRKVLLCDLCNTPIPFCPTAPPLQTVKRQLPSSTSAPSHMARIARASCSLSFTLCSIDPLSARENEFEMDSLGRASHCSPSWTWRASWREIEPILKCFTRPIFETEFPFHFLFSRANGESVLRYPIYRPANKKLSRNRKFVTWQVPILNSPTDLAATSPFGRPAP